MNLRDLADECDREANNAWRHTERWRLRNTANLYRRMICNRAAADPTTHTLDHAMLIDVTERWCRQHGYRVAAGIGGATIQRGDEPTLVVRPGDTLHWDGEKISVELGR
ncbi:hypothetical protein ACWCPF_25805 [Streptomyces sp. NPDC001858]